MALKIQALLCSLIAASVALSSLSEDHRHHHLHHQHEHHHAHSPQRFAWPVWYRDRLLHTRHGDPMSDGTTSITSSSTRSPWSAQPQVFPTSRHVGQRTLEHRLNGGGAVARHNGTGTIAYASYRDDQRHQPREAVTQSYQLFPTTAPTYTRYHSGRRVCTRQTPTNSYHHRGREIRLVYTELTSSFLCCPGWSQATHLSFGCNKPTCPVPCLNGGMCTLPGKCTCPRGYTGNQCQIDVDECLMEKPCGQLCTNLPGSYRCHCRAGFQLQQDGQSCRRNDTDENAFEARDLERDFHDASTTKDPTSYNTENEVSDNDQDYEIILKRLTKLEKLVARNRKRDAETSEMNTKVTLAVESINEMKRTIENVQLMQQEIYDMRSKMKQYETEMRKIQHLMNRIAELENRLRIRCRSMSINNGSLNF